MAPCRIEPKHGYDSGSSYTTQVLAPDCTASAGDDAETDGGLESATACCQAFGWGRSMPQLVCFRSLSRKPFQERRQAAQRARAAQEDEDEGQISPPHSTTWVGSTTRQSPRIAAKPLWMFGSSKQDRVLKSARLCVGSQISSAANSVEHNMLSTADHTQGPHRPSAFTVPIQVRDCLL